MITLAPEQVPDRAAEPGQVSAPAEQPELVPALAAELRLKEAEAPPAVEAELVQPAAPAVLPPEAAEVVQEMQAVQAQAAQQVLVQPAAAERAADRPSSRSRKRDVISRE